MVIVTENTVYIDHSNNEKNLDDSYPPFLSQESDIKVPK